MHILCLKCDKKILLTVLLQIQTFFKFLISNVFHLQSLGFYRTFIQLEILIIFPHN